MSERFSRRILEHIADRRYEPRTVRQLAHDLSIGEEQLKEFQEAADQLLEEGQLVLGSADTIGLPPPGREMVGVFRLHERGFGFLAPDALTEHGDLFIPPDSTLDALTGDRVRAKVIHEKRRATTGKSPYVGRIVEILQRADKRYVGTLIKRGSMFVVQVDGRALHDPVMVRDPHAKDAKVGDKVVIELIEFPDRRGGELPEGVITEVLGESGEPAIETLAVMRAHGLAEHFPPQVMEAAREAAALFRDHEIPADREDLTGLLICTIDPPDAKDFDDAISIRRLDGGAVKGAIVSDQQNLSEARYELGVHIADVAHFVSKGSALDEQAYSRGNSTYLPRRVVPMLPELLSNGVCSLQESVNRYTKSCFLYYDGGGNVLGFRFCRSVIRSAKRLTYLEAQALIDDDLREAVKHARSETKYGRELIGNLKLMDELAKIIRKRRLDDGMIVLGLPEVQLVFDDSGRVVDAVGEDTAFTHTIIEMFMVEANEAAARAFDGADAPMIRRIHPDPDAHDIAELRTFARVAGYNIPARPSRKELQTLLDAVRGKPAQHAVHLAVLKTLSKAEYSPLTIGHFALASEHYTHFTSPIRRYPDLIVHRGLDAYLEHSAAEHGKGRGSLRKRMARALAEDPRVPNDDELREAGRHCSNTERNSEAAERQLRTYLLLEMLNEHLGEDFQGTVTGVTSAGVFIELDRYLVDGFVRVAELPGPAGERWQFNRTTGALVAQRSGRTLTIGDRFVVRIAKIDLGRRQMDLVVVEDQPGKGGKGKRVQSEGAKVAHQKTHQIKALKKGNQRMARPMKKNAKKKSR
jgi:ribonuclease R